MYDLFVEFLNCPVGFWGERGWAGALSGRGKRFQKRIGARDKTLPGGSRRGERRASQEAASTAGDVGSQGAVGLRHSEVKRSDSKGPASLGRVASDLY